MTKYIVEKCEDYFIVYNPACKYVKRRCETQEEAVLYREYLLKRDELALKNYKKSFC